MRISFPLVMLALTACDSATDVPEQRDVVKIECAFAMVFTAADRVVDSVRVAKCAEPWARGLTFRVAR